MKAGAFNPATPAEARAHIRSGAYAGVTSGLCPGYAQANLIALPRDMAYDFLLFAQRNPAPCPILEVTDPGVRMLQKIAAGADVATDIPRYRVFKRGWPHGEYTDAADIWRDDLVSFLIGCSFSFEGDLLDAGVPVRHIEEGRNVPMFVTNIECEPAGVFRGKMVVSMRPMLPALAAKAAVITGTMPRVHGAPVHIGDPAQIGIADIGQPDFGDAVTIRSGETPVFWPCGVTPQAAIMAAKPEFAITHAPGHMLITDVRNAALRN